MTLSQTPGSMKRFRRTHWPFQRTFETPLKNLPPFVAHIISAHRPIQAGTVTIDEIVFEPRNLKALLARLSIKAELAHDSCIRATGEAEAADLLQAMLSDWINFIFVPTPKRFAIYADHDEYITFFAASKSRLNRVVHALTGAGFGQVHDYTRHL